MPKQDNNSSLNCILVTDGQPLIVSLTQPSKCPTGEIDAWLTPVIPNNHDNNSSMLKTVFSRSGAGVGLAGLNHLKQLRVQQRDLFPCKKSFQAIGENHLFAIAF